MKWFAKSKNESLKLSQKLEIIKEQEEELMIQKNVNQVPTIDFLGQDVERRTPVFQPTAYGTIKPIVDELIEQKIILIDFSKLAPNDRVRTIDFITGVMYGLDGEYKKIERQIYKFIVRK